MAMKTAAESPNLISPADTYKIPASIELLENTELYDAPFNDIWGMPPPVPIAVLAPQEVDILAAETNWTVGFAWWKIHTRLGDKYIHPKPWAFQVAPPKMIDLFEETPIYAEPDDSLEPTASLNPQRVETVEGEPQWFMPNWDDPSTDLRWIKIRTMWVGDQWIRVPRYRIGYVEDADYEAFYKKGVPLRAKPGLGPYDWGNEAPHLKQDAILHIVSEFRSLFSIQYVADTEYGQKWIYEDGKRLSPVDETIRLTGNARLFAMPGSDSGTLAELNGVSVQADLTTKDYMRGTWYHVHSGTTEGWINTRYIDPPDAKPADFVVKLNQPAQLYQYPFFQAQLNQNLSPQTIRPTAYWDDRLDESICTGPRCEYGTWFQVEAPLGKAWIMLRPEEGDRLILDQKENALGIVPSALRNTTIRLVGDELYWRNDETLAGLRRSDGMLFIRLSGIAEQFRFSVSQSEEGTVIEKDVNGYAFGVKEGSKQANLFWNDRSIGTSTLSEVPIVRDHELLLPLPDLEKLMGLDQAGDWRGDDRQQFLSLAGREYNVEATATSPLTVSGDQLRIDAILYRQFSQADERAVPTLYLYDESGNPLQATTSTTNLGTSLGTWSFDLNELQSLLPPGTHNVTIVLKSKERILWLRDYSID